MEAAVLSETTNVQTPSRQSVLVVEDNLVGALVLCRGFEALNHATDSVSTGEEAIAAARSKPGAYYMIVMDACLKGQLDGFEATEKIREFDPTTPIVIVSAVDNVQWYARALQVGANGILSKPVQAAPILDFVGNLIGKRQESRVNHRRPSDPCLLHHDSSGLSYFSEPVDALREAVIDGDVAKTKALLASGENPDFRDPCTGNTLLHIAARNADAEMLHLLLDAGADVGLCSLKGYSALHVAAWMGSLPCVRLLHERGCDLHLKSKLGLNAADISQRQNVTAYLAEHGCTPHAHRFSPARARVSRSRSISSEESPSVRTSGNSFNRESAGSEGESSIDK